MRKSLRAIAILGMALSLGACGAIDTGNTGVRISWDNQVDPNEVTPGFYTAVLSEVEEWVGKEILVQLDNMTPKAGDNLTMAELDVEVYYTADPAHHADLKIKYANAHVKDNGYVYPAFSLVKSQSRTAVYKAVGAVSDSLTIHKSRTALEADIKIRAQELLDSEDDGKFKITKVLVKKANTDPSLEKSIQLAIKKDKELEAAEKEEEIQAAFAKANDSLTNSLTPEIMRIKELDAMVAACQTNTCIIDFTNGKGPQPLINVR